MFSFYKTKNEPHKDENTLAQASVYKDTSQKMENSNLHNLIVN